MASTQADQPYATTPLPASSTSVVSSFWYGGPLTTLFTPPSDCFATLPSTWSICVSSSSVSCYWSRPTTCYASGAATELWSPELGQVGEGGFEQPQLSLPAALQYTPGVLPVGYTTAVTSYDAASDATWVAGCMPGWKSAASLYCTSTISASYQLSSQLSEGSVAAFLPLIIVAWQSSDLISFTPIAAPIASRSTTVFLIDPTPTIISSATVAPTPGNKPSSTSPAKTALSTPTNQPGDVHDFSTGAKVGTSLGVIAFVAILAVVGWLLLRRWRASNSRKGFKGPTNVRWSNGNTHLESGQRDGNQVGADMSETERISPGRRGGDEGFALSAIFSSSARQSASTERVSSISPAPPKVDDRWSGPPHDQPIRGR